MKLTFSKSLYAQTEKIIPQWAIDLDGALIEFVEGQNWTIYHYGVHRVLIRKEWCKE